MRNSRGAYENRLFSCLKQVFSWLANTFIQFRQICSVVFHELSMIMSGKVGPSHNNSSVTVWPKLFKNIPRSPDE